MRRPLAPLQTCEYLLSLQPSDQRIRRHRLVQKGGSSRRIPPSHPASSRLYRKPSVKVIFRYMLSSFFSFFSFFFLLSFFSLLSSFFSSFLFFLFVSFLSFLSFFLFFVLSSFFL